MRLLLFNLATDADDPVLGFTTDWLNALAARCDAVDVLTMRAGRLALADNVRVFSVGKELGYSEARRALTFYGRLAALLSQHRYDAAFAHMIEVFALMSAPLLKPARVPITLWYAHKSVRRTLRWAERAVDHIVTASPESFRLPSAKVRVIGHGVDTHRFTPADSLPQRPFTLVTAGRIAPVKRLETVIAAAAQLRSEGLALRLRVVGEAAPADADYAAHLHDSARAALGDALDWAGASTYAAMPQVYRAADVMVNTSATGSVDKAVLEAMACGLPTVTANEAFHTMLAAWSERLLTPPDDAAALAARLRGLAEMSAGGRRALGDDLRALVVAEHSLDRLADRLIQLFAEGAR
jgi:glycosyltransferase involved in cell wall biosynthesis